MGIPTYSVVIALRDIKQGELLHTSYGVDHGLRGGKYFISQQSYQEVVAYCQIDHFYTPEKRMVADSDLYFEQMFDYIFGVSSLFIRLHLNEVLNVQKTQLLIKRPAIKLNFTLQTPPTYFWLYPQLLDTIAKILKLKEKDSKIVDSVNALSDVLTEAAFVQMLLLMQNNSRLTSASILHYQTLGELYDHLYLVLNGALNGTYLNKEDGSGDEKIPNFHPDISMIKIKYNSLPSHLKTTFQQQVDAYLQKTIEDRLTAKTQEFKEIFAIL
jgi:hypothetical protein